MNGVEETVVLLEEVFEEKGAVYPADETKGADDEVARLGNRDEGEDVAKTI